MRILKSSGDVAALILVLVFATNPAPLFAGSAGTRLGAEDISFRVRGLKAETFLAPLEFKSCDGNPRTNDHLPDLRCSRPSQSIPVDADGSMYFVTTQNSAQLDATCTIWRTTTGGSTEAVAAITRRATDDGRVDKAEFTGLTFDAMRGILYATLWTGCEVVGQTPCSYEPAVSVVRLMGFPTVREPESSEKKH